LKRHRRDNRFYLAGSNVIDEPGDAKSARQFGSGAEPGDVDSDRRLQFSRRLV
jgi:hypothetical protein